MPAQTNPYDDSARVAERAQQPDPWVMYYVVRKDHALTVPEAMSAAGAGAVACALRWRDSEAWARPFAAWQEQSYRKVALRASAAHFARLSELDCAVVSTPEGDSLLCLPPRRKSEREPLLTKLQAYTEPPRPQRDAEAGAAAEAMLYVVRADVMKSAGKAMAQAGHAALMCFDAFPRMAEWAAGDMLGRVAVADDAQWELLKREVDCVVVRDAGLTQVQAGTETVLAVPPGEQHPVLRQLQSAAA